MELQKKDQQKKLTWREIYLEETLNALENGGFYNRHCQFPRTIKLPITWKEYMCELGGMGNQFSTVLLVSTPTGGYPVGMALYGIKPNGVQATVKVYEKSYVGIATKHCDYTHLAIYRISDMHKDQTFVDIEGYSFGSVEAVLCYNADYSKDGTCKSSDESLFIKNTNLDLLKNKLLEKLSIRNCRTPIYIEPLVRLNANMNQGISNAIEHGWKNNVSLGVNTDILNQWYGSEDLNLFHSNLMEELSRLQNEYKFVYVRSSSSFANISETEENSHNWYTEISILYNNNGDAEPLNLHHTVFTYEHSTEMSSAEEKDHFVSEKNNNFMRQFTRSYFTTLFGFKSWKEMEEIAVNLKTENSKMEPVITYSKFYLTTKQFFTKTELTK